MFEKEFLVYKHTKLRRWWHPEWFDFILVSEQTMQKRLALLLEQKSKFFQFSTICSDDEKWFINDQLEVLDREIRQLKGRIYRVEHPQGDGRLEKAKNIPIDSVAQMLGVRTKRTGPNRLVCTIREEKIPSCTLYLDNNSYYDFGASYGGDVVSFYMRVAGCDFKTALDKLIPK